MFDSIVSQLYQLSGSPWVYVIVLGCIAGSAVFPPLPSESMIITAGVLAGAGRLELPLVVAVGAFGAFVGDNAAYLIGRLVGESAIGWAVRGERAVRSLRWAQGLVSRRGGPLIIVGRFIPTGRTAVSIAAGSLVYPWPRFVVFSAIGSIAWAIYGSLIGSLGGGAFEGSLWMGLLLAAGIALIAGGAIELVRRWQQGRLPWVRRHHRPNH